jgi:hypothetical protein
MTRSLPFYRGDKTPKGAFWLKCEDKLHAESKLNQSCIVRDRLTQAFVEAVGK